MRKNRDQMKLHDILKGADCEISGNEDIDIRGITDDSRDVLPGTLFIAREGSKTSGSRFVRDALDRGALAVMAGKKSRSVIRKAKAGTYVIAKDIKALMHSSAERFFGSPDRTVFLAGITGTNGKTTTTYLVESIWAKAAKASGVIGTINCRYDGIVLDSANTTPSFLRTIKLLKNMQEHNVKNVIMEVSSHALSQGRADNLNFDCAIFTNLTRDHLDYHRDFKHYFESKARLFELLDRSEKKSKHAVINADDTYGARLAAKIQTPLVTYGFSPAARFGVKRFVSGLSGSDIVIRTPEGPITLRTRLVGRHNIYNVLAAAAAAWCSGTGMKQITAGIAALENVPGRLERLELGGNNHVFIDYAHTDDALFNVLSTLNALKKKGRIITVFGCGGDRDKTKRPLMGRVAVKFSDYAIITSDNPRSEEPSEIAQDMANGISSKNSKRYQVILDRYEAIRKGVEMLEKNDMLLIAGKGHENYQIFRDRTIHFSDMEAVKELVSNNGKN